MLDFEREFPSLCFSLATGVGKTRLMGAFIGFLYLAHDVRNFFVLAPNLTIYNKLISDFTPNTPKYVFRGLAEFAVNAPTIITGDNYASQARTLFDDPNECKINIFNISKINTEVRGGRTPRIKKMNEYLGEPYFAYLSALPDLVLLMDESHRYRASAGVRAINELNPILGLELTATPYVETGKGAAPFKNVIIDYPLARAMADGFVKEPVVVTRKDFNAATLSADEVERIKLDDGLRLHEQLKVELSTYARHTGLPLVKPLVLVIARDTVHASTLLDYMQGDAFFDGRYRGRIIQVDSSILGKEEDEMIERLLRVERPEEPTEIVVHVNMLKEGWDVTNLYTIVPLRAANARVLIEQSIGRGLRLPYGKRSGLFGVSDRGERIAHAVDRLNIVAHDRFQEIVDEARRPDSPVRLQQLVLDPTQLANGAFTVISASRVAEELGLAAPTIGAGTSGGRTSDASDEPPFATDSEQKVAQVVYDVIRTLEGRTDVAPTVASLRTAAVQATVVAEVKRRLDPGRLSMFAEDGAIEAVVAKTTDYVARGTIDIPRILVVPSGGTVGGIRPFRLNLTALQYPVPSDDLVAQTLRTGQQESILFGRVGAGEESGLEEQVVDELAEFDDVSYEEHAALLHDLAGQTIAHLRRYLPDDHAIRKVLRVHRKSVASFIHAQMEENVVEGAASECDVRISKGFTELLPSTYSASAADGVIDFRQPPPDKAKIGRYLFAGFGRSLYRLAKFQSDAERKLAVILDRDALRWLRPARGQFYMTYRSGHDYREYQPDFVAEIEDALLMIEVKRASEVNDPEVSAKRVAGTTWCEHASGYALQHGGKVWRYVLIPHDVIAENMSLRGLDETYGRRRV